MAIHCSRALKRLIAVLGSGEAVAIKEFLQENPEISLRQFGFYRASGAGFIVSDNSN